MEIDALRNQLVELGDFSIDTIAEIAKSSFPERISDTLAIESIMVNRRVTSAVLQGNVLSDVDIYAKQAILNIGAANDYIEKVARAREILSLELISRINALVLKDLNETEFPGEFRRENVMISGASVQPPWWSDVRDMLVRGIEELETAEYHPLAVAAYAHWLVAHIHPFENGNGRTARLVQDFVLISNGYLPVGIPQARRMEYYDALAEADIGDGSNLVELIAGSEGEVLQRTIEVGQSEQKRRATLRTLVDAITSAGHRTEGHQFEVWKWKVSAFVAEMIRTLKEIDQQSMGYVRIRVIEEGLPDASMWKTIALADRDVWFKRLVRFEVSTPSGFMFKGCWFVKRHDMRCVEARSTQFRDSVAVHLDIRDQLGDRWDFKQIRPDGFITMRELIPQEKSWLLFSDPIETEKSLPEGVGVSLFSRKWLSDEVSSVGEISERFLSQLSKKIGL